MKENWISVLDQTPPGGQGVLIALNTGLITVGYRKLKHNSHDWQLFGDIDFMGVDKNNDYVTHWMQLPAPPNLPMKYSSQKIQEMHQYPERHWSK